MYQQSMCQSQKCEGLPQQRMTPGGIHRNFICGVRKHVNKPSPDGDAKEQIGCNLYTYSGNFVGNFQEWASYSSRALMYMVHCEDRYWSWVSSLCGTESFGGQLDTQYALFLKQQQKLGSHSASANWDYIAPPINYYYISVMWLDVDTSTSTTLQPQWIPFIASA